MRYVGAKPAPGTPDKTKGSRREPNGLRWEAYLHRWIKVKHDVERKTRFALQFPNRFLSRYHRRSAAESRFATKKALFGDRLRCRRPASRRNEVLAREIVHNVRLLTKRVPQPPAG